MLFGVTEGWGSAERTGVLISLLISREEIMLNVTASETLYRVVFTAYIMGLYCLFVFL